MASTFNISSAAASVACDALTARLDSGTLALYDGTQPATCGGAVGGATKLVEFTLGTPAYAPASDGTALVNAITPASAASGGTATWFRGRSASGATVCDGSVGTSGCDLNLSSTALQAGALVTVTGLAIVLRKS